MNRLSFLQQTLPKNIIDNNDYDNLEFVILNYNSKDDIDTWIQDNYSDLIKIGRLIYVKEFTATHFYPSHSRNVCARMTSGDIICNVDADNFTGEGFAAFLNKAFKHTSIAIGSDTHTKNHPSTFGRIAIERREFVRLGGYDESFVGWGSEDGDLIRRCIKLNFNQIVIPSQYLNYIEHNNHLRIENIDFSLFQGLSDVEKKEASHLVNYEKSIMKSNKGLFVANLNQFWGKAKVLKNFSDEIELKNPWISCL